VTEIIHYRLDGVRVRGTSTYLYGDDLVPGATLGPLRQVIQRKKGVIVTVMLLKILSALYWWTPVKRKGSSGAS